MDVPLQELRLRSGEWSFDFSFLEWEARERYGVEIYNNASEEDQAQMQAFISVSRKMAAYDNQMQADEIERRSRHRRRISVAGE